MADFCRHLLPRAGCLLTEKTRKCWGHAPLSSRCRTSRWPRSGWIEDEEPKVAGAKSSRNRVNKKHGNRKQIVQDTQWNQDNSPKFSIIWIDLWFAYRILSMVVFRLWSKLAWLWDALLSSPVQEIDHAPARHLGKSDYHEGSKLMYLHQKHYVIEIQDEICLSLYIYLIKCLYSLQYTHKYLAGKSVMKEDAVPVGKVDLHHYVSLRAFAIPYYIACGFRDWSPNQSRVCSEGWLFVSKNPYMHNRWPWPAIIGSQKCLSQRRWQVFAALWRALLEISHCTHGKQRLGAHFFGKWWWNDSEGNLFQLRTTVIPNFGREVSKFRFKRS